MLLGNLKDIRALFSSLDAVFAGVGMTAYSRIIPSYLLDHYYIIALRNTLDLPLLRKERDIFCLEEETGASLNGEVTNSAALLAHPAAKRFLKRLGHPTYLVIYQNYPELEILAKQEGWTLLANPASLRIRLGERAFFNEMADELDLPMIPGLMHPVEELHKRPYSYWAETIGPRFVVQLPEIAQGGGKGTFFVRLPAEYKRLQRRLKDNTWRGVKLRTASLRKFVDGIPASMALCITRQGLLFTGLQRQLMDLPYCGHLPEDGVFCGHVWDERPWPSTIAKDARCQALKIGECLAAMGYKGIFGIDFLIDKRRRRIYPIELNPRFTGVFPILSLLHMQNELIPLEAFHILEFLDLSYDMDVEKLNAGYREPLRGSHLLLFCPPGQKRADTYGFKPGLNEYSPENKTVSFTKGAIDYSEIRNDSQFILIDGPPVRPSATHLPSTAGEPPGVSDPHERLCRLIFAHPVVGEAGVLKPLARQAVDWVYSKISGPIDERQ